VTALSPGLYRTTTMSDYLALDAMGSTRLGWLAISPLHFKYMIGQPREETDATKLGTAVHAAVLEPEAFARQYVGEPDLDAIGGAKPRATKVYRELVAELEADGLTVLRGGEFLAVHQMKVAIEGHSEAAKLLARAPEREVTGLWQEEGGRHCRLRADLLGPGVLGDIKTTRSLAKYSPWVITDLGYHIQAAWYVQGLAALGHKVDHVFHVAIENTPPYDVGVFALDPDAIRWGAMEIDVLLKKLDECERTGVYPGMFPTIQDGLLSDAAAQAIADMEVA